MLLDLSLVATRRGGAAEVHVFKTWVLDMSSGRQLQCGCGWSSGPAQVWRSGASAAAPRLVAKTQEAATKSGGERESEEVCEI